MTTSVPLSSSFPSLLQVHQLYRRCLSWGDKHTAPRKVFPLDSKCILIFIPSLTVFKFEASLLKGKTQSATTGSLSSFLFAREMANQRLLLRLLIALVCLCVLFSFTFCLSDDDDYDEVTTVVTPIDSKPVAVAPSLSVVVTSELNLDDDEDEDEDMDKELTTSKITSTVNSIRSQKPKDFDDDDDDYEEDDDGDDDSSSCSAQFFLEKLIPEDYPTAISKDVSHINETIQRLNKMHAYSTQLRDNWTPFIRELGSHLSDSLYEAQLETNCMVSLYKIISAVQNDQKAWALSCK